MQAAYIYYDELRWSNAFIVYPGSRFGLEVLAF